MATSETSEGGCSYLAGIGRAAIIGGTIGFVVVTVAVSVVVALAGGGSGSLGAGVLVGFFGGVGFGAMEGATAYADRHPDNES